ncbi:MAG: hypothetical protein BMS9Abin37_1350 [Acidobacteriota bacterium]|nr:MAG: hypothetical protein BMS9Abin37_1350 [Acidobacteriota bacterium]
MEDMVTSIGKEERQGLIRKFLSSLRFPQLFLLLAALFTVDMVTPDPIFLVDEAILGVLAVMLGMWRRRGDRASEMKNITPEKADD